MDHQQNSFTDAIDLCPHYQIGSSLITQSCFPRSPRTWSDALEQDYLQQCSPRWPRLGQSNKKDSLRASKWLVWKIQLPFQERVLDSSVDQLLQAQIWFRNLWWILFARAIQSQLQREDPLPLTAKCPPLTPTQEKAKSCTYRCSKNDRPRDKEPYHWRALSSSCLHHPAQAPPFGLANWPYYSEHPQPSFQDILLVGRKNQLQCQLRCTQLSQMAASINLLEAFPSNKFIGLPNKYNAP